MCRKGPSEEKRDIPFADDAGIAAMIEQFEACRWPFAHWSHRCHLAAAAWYLRRWPDDVALEKVRSGIQLYNRTCGTGEGYHETITRLFLRTVRDRLNRADSNESLVSIVNGLARTRTVAWVREYYSEELLASPEAIASWVEPDLKSPT